MQQLPFENNSSYQPPNYVPPRRPKDNFLPSALFLGLLALLLMCVIVYSVRLHEVTAEPQINAIVATPEPIKHTGSPAATVQPEMWNTIETFHGSSDQVTDSFTVTNPWRLTWTCYPPRDYGYTASYNLFVYANGKLIVNTICSGANLTGHTIQLTSGSMYLDIETIGQWRITVDLLT